MHMTKKEFSVKAIVWYNWESSVYLASKRLAAAQNKYNKICDVS